MRRKWPARARYRAGVGRRTKLRPRPRPFRRRRRRPTGKISPCPGARSNLYCPKNERCWDTRRGQWRVSMANSWLSLIVPNTVNGTVPPRRQKNSEASDARISNRDREVDRLIKAAKTNRYGRSGATCLNASPARPARGRARRSALGAGRARGRPPARERAQEGDPRDASGRRARVAGPAPAEA